MATPISRRLVPLAASLLLAAALGCRKAEPPPPAHALSRGGELVASLRSEPGNYNRFFEASAPADLVSLLTQARLVRVNRTTDAVEPALAASWQQGSGGTTLRIVLRDGVSFSDGVPFTSADVLFSLQAAYDAPGSLLADALTVGGQKITATAPDARTLDITFPAPFAPGIRLFDNLPILPRHKLEAAFKAGTLAKEWTAGGRLNDVVGLGPFVLTEHAQGRRLVFTRNEHYYRRDDKGAALPNLDRLVVEIIPDTNAEALRLESGATDLMSNGDIRPDDFARFKRLADQGRLHLVDGGVGLDPNVLWFNLKPAGKDARPWLRTKAFRQALSLAADRQAIANTVYLGAAVPIFGPITPRNATWFVPPAAGAAPDSAKARRLLAGAGFTDRNGDGLLESSSGAPVRFSMLVQQGHSTRERTATLLQDQFRRLGIVVDVVGLDPGGLGKRWMTGDYDTIFHGFQASATDPAMNLDFWLSSGSSHVWNPGQKTPATEWERRIDDLMHRQTATTDLAERQRLFAEVQQIFADELPALYFVAPKVTLALSPRVLNPSPAPQIPQLLWSADTLGAARR